MKILITGGSGYIAKSINNTLSKIYDITSITRQDFDLENLEAFNKWIEDKNFDILIHTAIKGGSRLKSQTEADFKTNLNMFNNIVFHKSKFKKIISLGSGAEIWDNQSPYGKSKKLINADKTEFSVIYIVDKNFYSKNKISLI